MAHVTIERAIYIADPAPGQHIIVTDTQYETVLFTFNPDDAVIVIEGVDITFEFPDESTVSFPDFLAEGLNEAPEVQLPDGRVYTAREFLELFEARGQLEIDEEIRESGLSVFNENMQLLQGIDRLGGLDVAFDGDREEEEHLEGWGDHHRLGEDDIGEVPDSWYLDFFSSAYEDDQPHQDVIFKRFLEGYEEPGRINFVFNSDDGVEVMAVRLSGFHPGSIVWLGNPNDGGIIILPDANGVYTVSYEQLMNIGVYYDPPEDDDTDMFIQYEVDLDTHQGPVTITGQFLLIVDAVADKPDNVMATPDGEEVSGSLMINDRGIEEKFDSGWATKDIVKHSNDLTGRADVNNTSDWGVSFSIPVHLEAQFYDFDGSESHLFYIMVPDGEGWSCTVNGQVMMIVSDLEGYEGIAFFVVPENLIRFDANGKGSVDIMLNCANPDGHMVMDSVLRLRFAAVAIEHPTDQELDLTNNVAVTDAFAFANIDTVSSGLSVSVGWASEGGDGAKYGGAYDPTLSASHYADATEGGQYALIAIGLTVPTQRGETALGEVITQITITYDASLGTLVDANGNPLSTATSGTVTITLGSNYISADGQSLILGSVKFQPRPGVSDADLDNALNFTVRVEAESGASAEFTGSSTVVIDAVADRPDLLTSGVDYGNYDAVTPGGIVDITGSARYYDLDGSELLYTIITLPDTRWSLPGLSHDQLLSTSALESFLRSQGNMPPAGFNSTLDAMFANLLTDVNGNAYFPQHILLQYDPATGKASLYAMDPATGAVVEVSVPNLTVSLSNGVLTYSVPVQVPDVSEETSFTVKTHALSLEQADTDREYDYSNNIAVAEESGSVTVIVQPLTGVLTASLSMHEDGQANQYLVANGQDPATGDRDTTLENGYNPATGMPITMDFAGASAGEYVSSITISTLPNASQGVMYYNGNPLTLGQTITNPDLSAFSFKPAPNFSGDVNFGFSYTTSSTTSGPGTSTTDATASLHVDSVADLADASSQGGGRVDGQDEYETQEQGFEQGWDIQTVAPEQSVDITFTITATFTDLDGSEQGWIDVMLPHGFSIPNGFPYELITDSTGTYARVLFVSTSDMASSNGTFTIPVTLTMDSSAALGLKTITVRVVSNETDTLNSDGHSLGNNTATRVITQEVDVNLFPGELTVRTGWAYEGNKIGGTASSQSELEDMGLDAASTRATGAPLLFELSNGSFDGGTITVPPGAGALYYSGTLLTGNNGVYTLTGEQLTSGLLVFQPAPGYTDSDVSLSYTLTARDAGGNPFNITGDTTVVIDAVADAGLINGEVTAVTPDNEALTITFNDVVFADQDGSEKHYLLVEALAGWACAQAQDIIVVYFDANGNPLRPTGMDADGNYTYDHSQIASQKYFFRIDVTDQTDGSSQTFIVTLTPPVWASDVTISTGTLSEEVLPSGSTGREYDLANNQAWEFKDVFVNFVDAQEVITAKVTYEDQEPNQHLGNDDKDAAGGIITVAIEYDEDAPPGGGEYISQNNDIVVEFDYDGPGAPGTFLFNGTEYTATSMGGGRYTLTLPANQLPAGSTQFNLQYIPPLNDDTDLTNLTFTLTVVAQGTGFDREITGTLDILVVDAVADKPTDVTADPQYTSGNTAVISGAEMEMQLTAQFYDYEDGSERHYMVFDLDSGFAEILLSSLPASWDFIAAGDRAGLGLSAFADGSRFIVVEVPNSYLQGTGGRVDIPIRIVVDEVTRDQTLTLRFSAVAVETPTDEEVTESNNLAVTPGTAEVVVHVVSSDPVLNVGIAYENDNRLAHIGQDASSRAMLSIGGMDPSEVLTSLTIEYDGSAGSFWYNGTQLVDGSSITDGNVTITCTDISNGDFRITFTASGLNDVSASVAKTGFTPANNYSDADVPLIVTGTVVDTGSGEVKNFGDMDTMIIVDAVAQKPTDVDSDVTYDNGYTAAADRVNISVEATFYDTADGSESHYLLIEYKSWMDVTGLTRITVHYDANGNVLTPSADGKTWYYQDPATGRDVQANSASTRTFIQLEVDSYIEQYQQGGASSQTFGDYTVTMNGDGSFSVTFAGQLIVKTGSISADIHNQRIITGGMAQEGTSPPGETSNREGYQYNNTAYTFDETRVSIAIVETIGVSVLFGSAYEQDAPNANTGDYTRAGGGGLLVVRQTPTTADYSDEQITVTFTYQALYQDDNGNWVLPGTITYNGVEQAYTINQATGLVTVIVTLDTTDTTSIIDSRNVSTNPVTQASQIDGSGLRFVPSYDNFNEKDVNLTYKVSVEDTASGATADKGAGSGRVVVDAVADLPVISNVAWDYENDGYNASSSANVNLTFDVTFPDTGTNGLVSEVHYILVQQVIGLNFSDGFAKAVTDAGYSIISYPVDGVLYYRIPVEFFEEVSPGVYRINIPLTLREDLGDIANFVTPNVVAIAIVEYPHGGEPVTSNNIAQAEVDVPDLNFAIVNTTVAGGSSFVYEGDTPNAHVGDYTAAGGTNFGLGISIGNSLNGAQEVVSNITFTYDSTRGTLYYRVPDSGEESGYRLVAVPSGGTVPAQYSESLTFIPKDNGLSNADGDIGLRYSFTVTDPASGAQKTFNGTYEIIVDAVAEQPIDVNILDVLYGGNANGYLTYNQDVTFRVSATFPDYAKAADGHADHYILIQKPGELWTINYPGAEEYVVDGVTYFRIPVTSFDANGKAILNITLHSPSTGPIVFDNAQPIAVGALTVDRDPNKNSLPNGDQEITYTNNWAYADQEDYVFRFEDSGTNYFHVNPLYENNKPNGNQLGSDGQPVDTEGGGEVYLSNTIQVPDGNGGYITEEVDYVDLTWDSNWGDLYVNGQKVTPDANGTYRIPASDFGNVYFRVKEEYADGDGPTIVADIHTTDGNTYTETSKPIVDAVANVPTDVDAGVNYGKDASGDDYTAVKGGEPVDIEVSAKFYDLDGSENLYMLVEAQPGWGNPEGYPVIYGPDGKAYFQIPVDPSEVGPDGTVTKTVTLVPPADGGTTLEDGRTSHNLSVGAMTEEDFSRDVNNGIPRGDEVRDDNNVSYNLTGDVTVITSTAESNPVLNVTDAYAGSDRDGDGIPDLGAVSNIYISGLNAGSDTISQVELTYSSNNGSLLYNGQPIGDQPGVTLTDLGNGNVKVTITNPDIINALTSGGPGGSAVTYEPSTYSDKDVDITASITVNDLFSSDSKTVGNTATVTVDAVARQPEDVSFSIDGFEDNTAVTPNTTLTFQVTATFPDINDPSVDANHYLAVQAVDGWTVSDPLPPGVSLESLDGVPYYLINVDLYSDSPALVKNPDGSYTFSLEMTSPNSTVDVSDAGQIKGGALTIVNQTDNGEITLSNNENMVEQEITLNLGVVETTEVNFHFDTIVEDSAAGSSISLTQESQNALASNNEKVTDTTLTFTGAFDGAPAGTQVGTIIYDGKAYPVLATGNGTEATVNVDFGDAGYDPSKDFRVVWGTVQTDASGNVVTDGSGNPVVTDWNHMGSDMNVSGSSTVVDKASGDSKPVDGTGTAEFTGTPDAPDNVDVVTGPTGAVGPGQNVSFTVEASFVDVDGSEEHYILVEQLDGWTGNYDTVTIDGVSYFKVPVSSTDPNPRVTVTLQSPTDIAADDTVTLAVGGMSVEEGQTATTFGGASVDVELGAVQATDVTLSMSNTLEEGYTQMLFALVGGDNDSIRSITITDLNGGTIVDSAGNVIFAGAPAVLDGASAANGDYYYKPPEHGSGTFEVEYSAVVQDDNSGTTITLTGSESMDVTPVSTTPEDAAGTVVGLTGTQLATVTLNATFPDNDGSESHFFLVTLPAGVIPPDGWVAVTDPTLLTASGLTGPVYQVDANSAGQASFTVDMSTYTLGDFDYVAVASENALSPPQYAVSDLGTIPSPGTGPFTNPAPAMGTLPQGMMPDSIPPEEEREEEQEASLPGQEEATPDTMPWAAFPFSPDDGFATLQKETSLEDLMIADLEGSGQSLDNLLDAMASLAEFAEAVLEEQEYLFSANSSMEDSSLVRCEPVTDDAVEDALLVEQFRLENGC